MKPTQTGIAVALALIVVIIVFILPGLSPFGTIDPGEPTTNESTDTALMTTSEPITQLETLDTVVGTGETAETGDTITVHYVGSFTDGKVFDASANHAETQNGFTFTLGGRVIAGWNQGLIGMRVGGKRHLVIPAELAYGEQGASGVIPPNTPLVFDVELLKVEKGGGAQ